MFFGSEVGFWASNQAAAALGSYIVSVQQVAITLDAGVGSNTATISSVNTGTTFLVFQGSTTTNSARNGDNRARITLTNSTTVTADRTLTTNSTTIYAVVVECSSSLVSSVQFGSITNAAASSNTATITSVDTARSAIFYLGNASNANNTSFNQHVTRVALTNATTVTATSSSTPTNITNFVVVEFNASAIQSVQPVSISTTAAGATATATISSVNTSRTMLASGGFTCGGTAINEFCAYFELTNATTVTVTREAGATSTTSRAYNMFVIEFAAGVVASNQAGTITLSGAVSNTATISSVNTARTILNFLHFSHTSTGTASGAYSAATLTNATTATAVKSSTTSTTVTGYSVMEFN